MYKLGLALIFMLRIAPTDADEFLKDPAAKAEPHSPPVPCTTVNGVEPLCGFAQPPEDLALLPDGRVLVGEFGALGHGVAGRLSVFDPHSKVRKVIFDGSALANGTPPERANDHCPGPPGASFSPHGIHLASQGEPQRLLVVNHGGRESIEIFSLSIDPATHEANVQWQDCVVAPADAWFNDVVNLPNSGFAVTHMIKRGASEEELLAADVSRADTGYVLQWYESRGWEKVPGTDGGLPNGIEASADGTTLYVNHYLADRVVAVDRASGQRLWSAEVAGPDNTTLAPNGELLVASLPSPFQDIIACAHQRARPCGIPYAVVALDPTSGAARTIFNGEGAPMGAATVALQVGNSVYLGSFVGERMVVRSLQ